jgi:hypothetical protein
MVESPPCSPLSNMEKYIRAHLRYNVTMNLMDGAFFGLALGFGSFATIIPLFVTQLTDSAILIGLAPAFHAIGWQLPQLFNAGQLARAREYKPIVLRNTIHERIPFLVLALIAFLIPWIGIKTALFVTFIAPRLAGNRWRVHCESMDEFNLEDHPARITWYIFRDARRVGESGD